MSRDQSRSLPKFGLLTSPVESVPQEIVRFHRLGFDYAEIGIEEPNATPQILIRQKDEILSSLSLNGMFAVGHTAYWVGFGSSHEKVRRGWIEEAEEMIHVASELKIGLLNFHFYGRHGMVGATEQSKNRFLWNFADAMEELTEFAATEKVSLMLENPPPENRARLESLECFSFVMKSVPALRFHLDVGHAFIENRMRGVRDYLEAFGDRLAHVHMHDNHGKEDEHLALGKGKIDTREVIRLLKEVDYDRTITFEVFSSHADAVRSMRLFSREWSRLGK
jgi:sugar phosphate isomerase/epimerase